MTIFTVMYFVCHTWTSLDGQYSKNCKWENGPLYIAEDSCKAAGEAGLTEILHGFNPPGKREAYKCVAWTVNR